MLGSGVIEQMSGRQAVTEGTKMRRQAGLEEIQHGRHASLSLYIYM